MTEAIRIQTGDTVDFTPSADVALGEVVPLGTTCVGVAERAIANGVLGSIALTGVFLMTKKAPLVIAFGDRVYWDATNNRIDKTTTNIPCGTCVEAALSAATAAKVRLDAFTVDTVA